MSACPILGAKGAFPGRHETTAREAHPMDEIHPVPDQVLRRLPGLFRRWELAQVIEAGKDYHVEDAGSACDGTTLYAVYVSTPVAPEAVEARL
jgi:hypothetical protein